MKNVVDILHDLITDQVVGQICFDILYRASQGLQPCYLARGKIVYDPDYRPFTNEPLYDMCSDETGTAGPKETGGHKQSPPRGLRPKRGRDKNRERKVLAPT